MNHSNDAVGEVFCLDQQRHGLKRIRSMEGNFKLIVYSLQGGNKVMDTPTLSE